MRYVKQVCIIFGITMVGELLNRLLPLPVPAGVYGLFLLLAALWTKLVKLEDVEVTGNFLLDAMPMMFVPVTAELIENLDMLMELAVPLIVISIVSTVIVLGAAGGSAELIIRAGRQRRLKKEHGEREEKR